MADSRDMYVVHALFRREFGEMPALVRGVPAGGGRRVAAIASHVEFMVDFLHAHHRGEDEMLWPLLLERVSADLSPTVARMEEQHGEIDRSLSDATAQAEIWRSSGAAMDGETLAATLEALCLAAFGHFDLEESEVLPLIDKYLTSKEWTAVGGSAMSKLPNRMLPVAFGMALYGATPEMVQVMKSTIPTAPWLIFSTLGPRAYARYARKVRGIVA